MSLQIVKATRKQLKVKVGFMGTAGSGKTWTALSLAAALGEKPLVIDSERGRASAYAGDFSFDHIVLPDSSPETYIEALFMGIENGNDVMVVDSISHEWAGKDGILAGVDRFGGWKQATPRHDEFIETLFRVPTHVICTMRAKTQYQVEEVERANGSKTQAITKLGLGPIQRDNVEYEFDLVGMFDMTHAVTLHKSVIDGLPSGGTLDADPDDKRKLGRELGDHILTWINQGEEVKPATEAKKADVEKLTKLLKSEGFDQAKIDNVFRQRRLELGALTPEYVAEQIKASEERLKAKGRDPETAAAAGESLDKAQEQAA